MKNKVKSGKWSIQTTSETKRLFYESDRDGTVTYQGNAPSWVQDADIVHYILNKLKIDEGDRIVLSNGSVFSYGTSNKTAQAKA